jgi:hypothetical protein
LVHCSFGKDGVEAKKYKVGVRHLKTPITARSNDRAVLRLVAEETFSGADFQLQSDGVCRLNPELARRVVQFSAK